MLHISSSSGVATGKETTIVRIVDCAGTRVKHIERRHFFIRECVEEGKIRVPFVATDENVADFFTKPLTGKQFFNLRDKVMNVPHSSTRYDDVAEKILDARDKWDAANIYEPPASSSSDVDLHLRP